MRAIDRYVSMELGVRRDRQQIHAKHTKENLVSLFVWILTLLVFCIGGGLHIPLACFWQRLPRMGMLKMDIDVVITAVWLTVR